MESPRPVPSLTSELLEEIFVRIGSPADLVRASTACAAFRRLIADPSFLRRYRSLHPPQLLGFIEPDGRGFQPVQAPHVSAAVARAVARAADFSFDNYLPRGAACRGKVHDARDGRVLLEYFCDPMVEVTSFDLAVCDPLARRCLLLPPIPDDLLASVLVQEQDFLHFDALLWSAVSIPLDEDDRGVAWFSRYANGCFYCCVKPNNKCFKFDMSSMEFSAVDLPPGFDERHFIIVDAGEGRLGMFTQINNGTSVRYTIWQIGGLNSHPPLGFLLCRAASV
ncbi:hypothetical protein U9M48_037437 [Paspalum notatum var. saurae]|uniref:F-box domain-containing protein n=1 Tax=Paspalum notatum var. saurae TaxID=547442 RepID=A0AAQ3XAM6_PASNO